MARVSISCSSRYRAVVRFPFPFALSYGLPSLPDFSSLIIRLLRCLVDGQPDLSTLRAFTATHQQGISYRPNVWHAPLISLGADKHDFACVVHETGVPEIDCEIKWFEEGVVAVVEEI